MSVQVPALELQDLTKAFQSCVANDGVCLRVEKGTIHGIVGENGAGKSTAMKMLYGLYKPDSGQILLEGEARQWRSPLDAIAAGIGMVHQHFMLAGPETALDNILLGAEPSRGLWNWLPRSLRPIDREGARDRLERLSRQYGLPVDWDAPVESLPVGIQQRIEILKLLYRNARILILDEPTAVLTPTETDELFENLKRMRGEGKTILVITHKLREVMNFTDRVTVFRAGKVTGELSTRETSAQGLADLMVGRKVLLSVEIPRQPELRAPVLEMKGLTLRGAAGRRRNRLYDVNLEVRGGEIVGIAGVEGNGQSELLQAILHPAEPTCRSAGVVRVLGQDATELTTRQIKALGVAFVPEDRLHEGLLPERPVVENFMLGHQHRQAFSMGGLVSSRAVAEQARAAMDEYDVRPRDLEVPAGRLSGGNQQKLIIARELGAGQGVTASGRWRPQLIVAAQPTRGVDVGAIEFIHKRLLEARTAGAGVLLVSSELDEILSLSDRILVMYGGIVVARFARGEVTEKELGLRMGGATGAERGPSL